MALNRSALRHTVVKNLGPSTVLTIGATVAQTSSVLDLRAATQQAGKYTFAKFVYMARKAGTAGTGGAVMTITTGSTNAANTALANYPVSTVGTDAGHGYASASTNQDLVVVVDVDLMDSGVQEFLKATVGVTGTASDTFTGMIFVILGGAVEAPVTNTAMLTTG